MIELCDPNKTGSDQGCGSALINAASRGDIEVVQTLLEHGAKIDFHCDNEQTALWKAVENLKLSTAKYLIEKGADINLLGYNGENILMMAAGKGDSQMVQMLVDKKFPVNLRDNRGRSALIYAINEHYPPAPETVNILIKGGTDVKSEQVQKVLNSLRERQQTYKALGIDEII